MSNLSKREQEYFLNFSGENRDASHIIADTCVRIISDVMEKYVGWKFEYRPDDQHYIEHRAVDKEGKLVEGYRIHITVENLAQSEE